MIAKRLLISGKVQGVSFRYHTHEQARALGLKGWVQNLEDGRVEVQLFGDEKKVDEIIKWAHRGPPAAKVDKVEVSDLAQESGNELKEFSIKREGSR